MQNSFAPNYLTRNIRPGKTMERYDRVVRNTTNLQDVISQTENLPNETDAEISKRIAERFRVVSELTHYVTRGHVRSLIISGPPGLGKSYTVEKIMEAYDPEGKNYDIIKGFTRPTGIYKSFWQNREKGKIVIFDDCDSAFGDDVAMNLIKTACDTTEKRILSWRAETKMVDDEGELVERKFEFNGSVIFITNEDFDKHIMQQKRLAVHFDAMRSRSFYIDMAMYNSRDYMIRLKQVIEAGILEKHGLNEYQSSMAIKWIEENYSKLQELSIRILVKLAQLIVANPETWERDARITLFKHKR